MILLITSLYKLCGKQEQNIKGAKCFMTYPLLKDEVSGISMSIIKSILLLKVAIYIKIIHNGIINVIV